MNLNREGEFTIRFRRQQQQQQKKMETTIACDTGINQAMQTSESNRTTVKINKKNHQE